MINHIPYINNDNPLVSVVILSYNRAATIVETIDSILQQKCKFNFEIIIGDDCSTDNVRDKLQIYQEKFPHIIKLIYQEYNIGLGANWATCVKVARGKYLAGCDNDDFWHNKNKLQLQVEFLEQNPEIGMVHTDYRELNRRNNIYAEKIIHNEQYKDSLLNTIFTGKFKCCNSSAMYRKSVIDEYVNLDDYILHKFPLQDWNTWIMITNFTKFYCLPISTTTVGIETESVTRPQDYHTIVQRFTKEKLMYKYLCDKFSAELPFNENRYDRYIDKIILNHAYKKSDYLVAKGCALKLIESGTKNLKIIMALNRVTFCFFSLGKHLRRIFVMYNSNKNYS